MEVHFIVNGGVSLLLSPETEAEAELIKQLMRQENDMVELRSSVVVVNKTFQRGILVAKKNTMVKKEEPEVKPES